MYLFVVAAGGGGGGGLEERFSCLAERGENCEAAHLMFQICLLRQPQTLKNWP